MEQSHRGAPPRPPVGTSRAATTALGVHGSPAPGASRGRNPPHRAAQGLFGVRQPRESASGVVSDAAFRRQERRRARQHLSPAPSRSRRRRPGIPSPRDPAPVRRAGQNRRAGVGAAAVHRGKRARAAKPPRH
jgi:hypothetical protein